MKRKAWTIAVAVALLLVVGGLSVAPRPVVGEDFEIYAVDKGSHLTDVVEQVDRETLAALLKNGRAWHFPVFFAPYQATQNTVEIRGRGEKSGHWIILFNEGKCVVYESADKGGYPILNAEELWSEVLELMP